MATAFAAATRDWNPSYLNGSILPPTVIATQTYRAQFAALFELVPESVFVTARSGVHGRHELLLHRPIGPEEKLFTVVETHSARPSGDTCGSRCSIGPMTTLSNSSPSSGGPP